jgi:hypothetical protein
MTIKMRLVKNQKQTLTQIVHGRFSLDGKTKRKQVALDIAGGGMKFKVRNSVPMFRTVDFLQQVIDVLPHPALTGAAAGNPLTGRAGSGVPPKLE